MKLIIGAGGTGGHIIPAIAVALELQSRGWEIFYIGNKNGMEKGLAQKYGFEFFAINVQKLYRKLTLQHLKFPFLFLFSFAKSVKVLAQIKPDAVLCTGGFVSGPVALAAVVQKRKLYFQDGNSYPGLTTRMFARYSEKVFLASEAAKPYLKKAKCVLTGNPLLKSEKINRSSVNWNEYNLSPETKKLFVLGGSQGSHIINTVLCQCIEEILHSGIELIWQTGQTDYPKIKKKFGSKHGIHCFAFTSQMNVYYQLADFAISRAGALTIAELQQYRLPAIFIPLPSAAENHQFKNAQTQVERGLGILLEQGKLSPVTLMNAISELIDKNDVIKMKLLALPENQAAQAITDLIERDSQR